MNILIPNSWLKDYLETNATPQEFAEAMSLTSVSIEHMEKVGDDIVYDIEVTTNRPDLMSIEGIAREASAVLPQAGFKAVYKPHSSKNLYKTVLKSPLIAIENDPNLVNRVVAVVMDVEIKPSPKVISERLEKTGIRSINNVVDVTNYIMREKGHPVHSFDYDRLENHTLVIRKSKKGEKITTLDSMEYILPGNDIVADNGEGKLVDLLGIMGLSNSSITKNTKRILLFLDNNNPYLLRKTSMNLGIRTEAAILNEKGVDPEIMMPTLLRGIELLKEIANGKVVSDIIDIYPNKPKEKTISVSFEKINSVIGVPIPPKDVVSILQNLGFEIKENDGKILKVLPPSTRLNDIEIPEDIIEEVARVYGYNKIPNILPETSRQNYYNQAKDEFYWIKKLKSAFLFWGFNEIYTYSMVSEELFEGSIDSSVKLKNPLTLDRVYLRNSLTPSILESVRLNKNYDTLNLFEIANVYIKNQKGLPSEKLHLAGLVKHEKASFPEGKGIVEQIFKILGIKDFTFTKKDDGILGANVKMNNKLIGKIEKEGDEITFEIDLQALLLNATSSKKYVKPSKFPPVLEDVRVEISEDFTFEKIKNRIMEISSLISEVSLLDVYQNKKTFHVVFLDKTRNLTSNDITPVRNKIYKMLEDEFEAKVG